MHMGPVFCFGAGCCTGPCRFQGITLWSQGRSRSRRGSNHRGDFQCRRIDDSARAGRISTPHAGLLASCLGLGGCIAALAVARPVDGKAAAHQPVRKIDLADTADRDCPPVPVAVDFDASDHLPADGSLPGRSTLLVRSGIVRRGGRYRAGRVRERRSRTGARACHGFRWYRRRSRWPARRRRRRSTSAASGVAVVSSARAHHKGTANNGPPSKRVD